MKLYVAYDKDGLPLYVADTQKELANQIGVSEQTIRNCLYLKSKKYAKVIVEDDE